MGEGAKEEVGGEPAGGLKPSTEAAVKRELQEAVRAPLPAAPTAPHRPAVARGLSAPPRALLQAAPQPGLLERFLQALAGSLSRDDEDQDDYPGGGGGGGVASGSSAPPPASPRPSAGPGSSGVGAGDPPAAMQAGVAAAGLAALPVVAWSEWALRDTGEARRRAGWGSSALPLPGLGGSCVLLYSPHPHPQLSPPGPVSI
jgi:hypothetical protein